jgi:hypothetical protein
MESTQLKLGREPRNDFERKIKEWEEKNVLVTLTREEREEEYQKALIELRDEMQEFIDTNYFDVSESMRERLMSRQASSLRYFIETPEEREQRYKEATQWFENFIGRKIPIYNG